MRRSFSLLLDAMVNQDRSPWKGSTKKLVVSIDIGTTYTAASFCVLQPGVVPKFEEVRRA
jgi:hypothetical protein